jgi:hypothetical protein
MLPSVQIITEWRGGTERVGDQRPFSARCEMAAMSSPLSPEVHCTAFNNCFPLFPDCPFQINPPDWDGFGAGISVPAY